MPYATNADLPARIKTAIPSEGGRSLFRRVFNSQHSSGKSESVAFASAWAALENAGYDKNSAGKYVKKAKSVSRGDRVSWSSSGGTARGIVRRVIRDGNVPGIDGDVKVTGTEDDPAAQIEIVDDDGNPTGIIVGHKVSTLRKAEYDGRDVELDKPFRLPDGSSKKFGVYVKDGDKVKRVTFGSPDMEIKRDDDEARANFRARHNCDTATDKTSARYWSCRMWESDVTVSEMTKRQLNDDQFTLREEAMARSFAMGFEDGAIHTHETADGIAVYMPGPTHEAYMQAMGAEPETESEGDDMLERTISAIMSSVIGKNDEKTTLVVSGTVLKSDEDQRIVWGWASVISENGEPIFDSQGDAIDPDTLTKAANEFMLDARVAKAMHDGDQVGEVIHSLPLTKELGEALGLSSDREGWIIAMKIHDDDVWQRVKSGELRAFSIGGEAIRNAVA